MNDMAEEVKLFKTWSSPFPLGVVWALELKGIQYESVVEDLSDRSGLLLQYSPVYKKVLVLLHNGRPISESLIILEYAAETRKQYPLLPQDPHARAMVQFWAKFSDDKIMPSIWSAFISEAKGKKQLLQRQVSIGRKFFSGENIGYLDVALGWLANLVRVFGQYPATERLMMRGFHFYLHGRSSSQMLQ